MKSLFTEQCHQRAVTHPVLPNSTAVPALAPQAIPRAKSTVSEANATAARLRMNESVRGSAEHSGLGIIAKCNKIGTHRKTRVN